MTTIDLTTATPSEVDASLARLESKRSALYREIDTIWTSLHHTVGDARVRKYGRLVWALDREDVEGRAERQARNGDERATVNLARLRKVQEERKAIQTEITRHEEVYVRRGGWSRFFLVDNTNGHIHKSTSCGTCRPTTQFGWLTDLSGQSEEEAVKAHGAMLCTRCFPSAPLEWTNHWDLEAERKKAEACPGSGTTDWVEGTLRSGYAYGNGGECSHCGEWAAATSILRIRKHKPKK